MKHVLFFSLKEDILPVLEEFEAVRPIRYVRFGCVTELPPESFNSATQIPNLGTASHPSAGSCESFLVCDAQIIIKPCQLKTITEKDASKPTISIGGQEIPVDKKQWRAFIGVDRFSINQLLNPNTITFSAGGLWDNKILLHGKVGTASESSSSQALMRRFQKALKKTFTKVKAFYVGSQAMKFLKNGGRLTIAVQSPREFDLTIE